MSTTTYCVLGYNFATKLPLKNEFRMDSGFQGNVITAKYLFRVIVHADSLTYYILWYILVIQ